MLRLREEGCCEREGKRGNNEKGSDAFMDV